MDLFPAHHAAGDGRVARHRNPGSGNHWIGQCRACHNIAVRGYCESGDACNFCHWPHEFVQPRRGTSRGVVVPPPASRGVVVPPPLASRGAVVLPPGKGIGKERLLLSTDNQLVVPAQLGMYVPRADRYVKPGQQITQATSIPARSPGASATYVVDDMDSAVMESGAACAEGLYLVHRDGRRSSRCIAWGQTVSGVVSMLRPLRRAIPAPSSMLVGVGSVLLLDDEDLMLPMVVVGVSVLIRADYVEGFTALQFLSEPQDLQITSDGGGDSRQVSAPEPPPRKKLALQRFLRRRSLQIGQGIYDECIAKLENHTPYLLRVAEQLHSIKKVVVNVTTRSIRNDVGGHDEWKNVNHLKRTVWISRECGLVLKRGLTKAGQDEQVREHDASSFQKNLVVEPTIRVNDDWNAQCVRAIVDPCEYLLLSRCRAWILSHWKGNNVYCTDICSRNIGYFRENGDLQFVFVDGGSAKQRYEDGAPVQLNLSKIDHALEEARKIKQNPSAQAPAPSIQVAPLPPPLPKGFLDDLRDAVFQGTEGAEVNMSEVPVVLNVRGYGEQPFWRFTWSENFGDFMNPFDDRVATWEDGYHGTSTDVYGSLLHQKTGPSLAKTN